MTIDQQIEQVNKALDLARKLPNGPSKFYHLSRLGSKKGVLVRKKNKKIRELLSYFKFSLNFEETDMQYYRVFGGNYNREYHEKTISYWNNRLIEEGFLK